MSVAPKRRASACRSAWRLSAMMRSAPMRAAASTPSRPTAPSPTTATVEPGRTPAATAAWCPVGKTSERVRSDASIASSAGPPAGHDLQRAVRPRHAHRFALAAVAVRAADEAAVAAGARDARAALGAEPARVAERHDHEVAGADVADLRPDLRHRADQLMAAPRARRLRGGVAVPPEVAAADARGDRLDHGIRRLDEARVGHVLHADVTDAMEDEPAHAHSPSSSRSVSIAAVRRASASPYAAQSPACRAASRSTSAS